MCCSCPTANKMRLGIIDFREKLLNFQKKRRIKYNEKACLIYVSDFVVLLGVGTSDPGDRKKRHPRDQDHLAIRRWKAGAL